MVESISSLLLSSFFSSSASTSTTSSESSVASSFGPDYLLSIIEAQTTATTGAAYDSTGTALVPPTNSPAGRVRAAALQKAQTLLRVGDTDGARAAALTVLSGNQGDPTANFLMGRAYLKDGDYRRAEQYLSRVAAGAPDNENAQADLRAVQTLQRGESATVAEVKRLLANETTAEEGTRLADYLTETKPNNVDARIALADYYERRGRLDQAGKQFVEAVEQVTADGADKLATRLERFAQAHNDDPSAHDLLARGYAAAGRLTEAETEFNQALELSNDDPVFQLGVQQDFSEVYTRLGREALGRADETAARKYFDQALKLNPDDARKTDVVDLETKIGERAMRQGLTNAALRAFGKAAAYLPSVDADADDERREKLIDGYTMLGNKLNAGGDLKRTVAARNGAYLLDADNKTVRRDLADSHDAYGLSLYDAGKYREAFRQFKAAVKLFGDDTNYAQHLADAQAKL